MKLYDVKPLFEAATLTPRAFPLLYSALSDLDKQRFEKYLGKMNEYLAAGEVLKSHFNDIKAINRCIDEGAEKLLAEPYRYGGQWETLPKHLQDLDAMNIAMHTIPGKLKKALELQKKGDHEFVQAYIALMNELMPLNTAQTKLKGMIVAKLSGDVQKKEAKEQFTANVMAHKDVIRVKKVLTEVTNTLREEVLSATYQTMLGIISHYYDQYDPKDPQTHNNRLNGRRPYVREIINKVSNQQHRQPDTLKDDYKTIARQMATKETNHILEQFIAKQTAKLAEILVLKDNMTSIKLEHARTGNGVVEGTLQLDFADDSSFEVNNKIVWAVSRLGTQFYRFPTTFHNVKMPNGKTLSGVPSEQRMKEEFAAK